MKKGDYITNICSAYPYDGHLPLTQDEELTQRAIEWYTKNRSKYYALGVSLPIKEADWICLLASFAKEFKKPRKKKNK